MVGEGLAREVKRIKGNQEIGARIFLWKLHMDLRKDHQHLSLSPQENESSSLWGNSSPLSEIAIEVCISIHGDRRCCRLPRQQLQKTLSKIPKP